MLRSKLLLLLFAADLFAQTPIAVKGSTGNPIDYYLQVNGSTPQGDTYYFSAYGANSLLATFPSSWADATGLPVLGTVNDGTIGGCSGNIMVAQLSKLVGINGTANSGNTAILPQNCMTSFGTASGDKFSPSATWGGHYTGLDSGTDATWKGMTLHFWRNLLFGCPYRQDSPGTIWGDSTCIISPDAGKTWVDFGRYSKYTVTGAACSGTTATLSVSGASGITGGIYVHGIGAVYNGLQTIATAGASTVTFTVPSCSGASGSTGAFGPLAANGSAPLGPSDASYPADIEWPLSGPVNGHQSMGVISAIQWGQDGSFPTPPDADCDPNQHLCGVAWDKTTANRSMIVWRVDTNVLDKAAFQWYTCATYPAFPGADGVCADGSGAWTSTQANATPVFKDPGSGAGYDARECFGVRYSSAHKSFIMSCIQGSTSQSLFYWAPHVWGPWYPAGVCPDCDAGFVNAMAYGEVVNATTPPDVNFRLSSGGCCWHTDPGNPQFNALSTSSGRVPFDGAARRYSTLSPNGQKNIGYRFGNGVAADTISRRGSGYTLDWWFDLFDHGGNTDGTATTQFRDLMNPSRYVQVLWNDGPQGSNYSHSISLDATGPTFGDAAYTQRLTPSFTDTTVGGGSGNNSWTIGGVVKLSVVGYASNKLWYLTHNNGADTPDVQVQIGGPGGSGAVCLVYAAGSLCTPTGAVAANTFTMVSVAVKAAGSGFPAVTIMVATGGTVTEYSGSGLTKTCSSCSATPNIATGGTWWIQNRPGGDGSGAQGTTSYGDMFLYGGAVPTYVLRGIYKTLSQDWLRAGRGDLGGYRIIPGTNPATNTQSVITYTAPDSSACTVEVSESPTYSPLVHDVDPALFTNSDQDTRSTSIVSGTSRKVVIGQRMTQLAADSKYYSRALQTNTTHYWRTTCTGGAQQTGTFKTATVPYGMTYQDFAQLDPASPGDYIRPSLSTTDPNQEIIDSKTGVKITRVGLPSDFVSHAFSNTGPFLSFGGFPRLCSDVTTNGGAGILCAFYEGGGDVGAGFYIDNATHHSVYLGRANWSSNPEIDPADGKWHGYNSDILQSLTYAGPYTRQPSGTVMPMTTTNILTNVSAAFHAFNAAFDPTHFGCGLGGSLGGYSTFGCTRNGQDSPAWVFVVDDSNGAVVAGTRMDANIQTRWCGLHNTISQDTAPSIFLGVHDMYGGGATLGHGPYVSTLVGSYSAGATSITVSGEPACAGCGADPEIPTARVGDDFKVWTDGTFHQDGTTEDVIITGKIDSTHWTITPFVNNHASGAPAVGQCSSNTHIGTPQPNAQFPVVYWNFLQDPTGTDTTGLKYVTETHWPVGGHDDAMHLVSDPTKDYRVTESDGWVGVSGDILTHYNLDPTFVIPATNTFAGATANAFGVGARRHPSKGPAGAQWFIDHHIWDKVPYNATLEPISGQVYRYHPGSFPVNPRYLPVASGTGRVGDLPAKFKSLLDVSPTTLGTTSADNYKMCLANVAGECFAGSAKGDIYVNVPGSPVNCGGNVDPPTDTPCLANFNAWTSTVMQIGIDGQHTRGISGGMLNVRDTHDTASARALPDGTGILFQIGNYQNNTPSNMLLATIPPYSLTISDGVDRTKFVPITIPLTSPGGSAVKAAIKFGYVEQGTPTQFYCTSRREACVANANSTPPSDGVTDPFKYITTDSWTGIACTTTCNIVLPVVPAHLVYYQAVYLDSGNAVVSTGPVQVTGDFLVR